MKLKKKIFTFQTEIKQLLNLVINSLYSNKEIFLRELISNASDAIDKLRFENINNSISLNNDKELKIQIDFDKIKKIIYIKDNGIGMTKNEVIENLGTIAKSGTKEFFSKLSGNQKKDSSLIGQFGVGFYSAFIVAKNIIVETKHAKAINNNGTRWMSNGVGEFSIENIKKYERGTLITLELKENENQFLSLWRIKSIINKYSDHISTPIQIKKEEFDKKKKEYVKKEEWETINTRNALWTRNKNDISKKEYNEFYKNLTNDVEKPLAYTHNHVEGINEYIQLLFIPNTPPVEVWDKNKHNGIKLYINRIFIMEDTNQLLPNYLRFIKGIIDSSNLSLNISREILQESREIKIIRESSTKKALNLIESLSKDKDKYKIFWKKFGNILKEGVGEDQNNKNRIINLLRFSSTFHKNSEEKSSFKDYINRMKKEQTEIYYVTGENYKTAKNSPHLEIFNKKKIEVLLLIDKIDEWILSFIKDIDKKKITSVAKGDLNLGKLENLDDKKQKEEIKIKFSKFIEKIKLSLKDKIKDVRITFRLTNSPSCLVANENELSGNLMRILKSSGQPTPDTKQILEINPYHPLVIYMKKNENKINTWSQILYNQAIISEGGTSDNPAKFINKINKILVNLIKNNK